MKRRIVSLLLALCMVLSLAATVSAEERYTSGDWTYNFTEGELCIVSYNGTATDVVIPDTLDGHKVEALGWGLGSPFADIADTMTSVVIPEGIRTMQNACFKNCTKLQSVTIPSTVRYMGFSVFEGCTSLSEVEIKDGVTEIGRYAFLNTALTSLYIPASVTEIDDYAIGYTGEWGDVESIKGFVIYGHGGTAAEQYASRNRFITFYDVTGATENSGACGEGATWRFEESTGTLYIEADPDADEAYSADYTNGIQPWALHADKITRLVVGEGILRLGDNTMASHYPNLREVQFPESLGEIGNNAFNGCTGLKQIDLPEDLHYILFQSFANTGLTSLVLPDALCYLGGSAFRGCVDLTRVKLPAELRDLGSHAFADCVKLATVQMPEGLSEEPGDGVFLNTALSDISFYTDNVIGWSMFQNCDNLTTVTIREGTYSIGNSAFSYCDNLTHVTIPGGVYSMGQDVFKECGKLSTVLFLGDAPNLNEFTFRGATATCYYPAGDESWNRFIKQDLGGKITWVAYDPDLFVDVPMNAFYYESVLWAVDNGITTGATATTFNPNGQCQRAQIVTFLWRAAGCPVVEAENPFTDVKETDFYYDAVLWAVENGITTGTSATTFSPFKTCSRAEVVTFLWRAHGKPGSNAENPFADVKDTDFFHTAVLWAVENGITNGMDATHFGSLTVCNRAQVVTFLYRAKDVAVFDPDTLYTFELKTNDPTEEIGWAFCEGTEFAAGESVVFYAEPWFGYLVEFEAEGELELYYLGACSYELIMPDHDVTLTVNFVPAQGDAHHIRTTCENAEFIALCDVDEEFNDIAKPGEFVQFHVMADEGYTLTPENITLTVGGESWEQWWFLGQVSEPDPELEMGSIFVFEAVMPDADLDVSIICTAGDTAAANTFRAPVSVK